MVLVQSIGNTQMTIMDAAALQMLSRYVDEEIVDAEVINGERPL